MFGLFKKKKVESLGDYQYQSATKPVDDKIESYGVASKNRVKSGKSKVTVTTKTYVSEELPAEIEEGFDSLKEMLESNTRPSAEQIKEAMEDFGFKNVKVSETVNIERKK